MMHDDDDDYSALLNATNPPNKSKLHSERCVGVRTLDWTTFLVARGLFHLFAFLPHQSPEVSTSHSADTKSGGNESKKREAWLSRNRESPRFARQLCSRLVSLLFCRV